MATASKSRAGAARYGTPLMLVCFLAIGGFLYWLSITAQSEEPMVVEEPDEVALPNLVSIEDFSGASGSYVGQEISLADIGVTSVFGPHSFWTSLADSQATPFLLHLGEALIADSASVSADMTISVTGTVTLMSDSVLDAWTAAGAFPQESDRFQAEFAESFIEVAVLVSDEAEEAGETDDPGAGRRSRRSR